MELAADRAPLMPCTPHAARARLICTIIAHGLLESLNASAIAKFRRYPTIV
jgi:hypothetical protein